MCFASSVSRFLQPPFSQNRSRIPPLPQRSDLTVYIFFWVAQILGSPLFDVSPCSLQPVSIAIVGVLTDGATVLVETRSPRLCHPHRGQEHFAKDGCTIRTHYVIQHCRNRRNQPTTTSRPANGRTVWLKRPLAYQGCAHRVDPGQRDGYTRAQRR